MAKIKNYIKIDSRTEVTFVNDVDSLPIGEYDVLNSGFRDDEFDAEGNLLRESYSWMRVRIPNTTVLIGGGDLKKLNELGVLEIKDNKFAIPYKLTFGINAGRVTA